MANQPGQVLRGHYELKNPVGHGGMADVWRAYDHDKLSFVALKILHPDLVQNRACQKSISEEAAILATLQHDNIVRLFGYEKEGNNAFLVLDWVEGENLAQRIKSINRPFSLAEVINILNGVVPALYYAHRNRIYHCDVKPSNILIEVTDRVILTDFGIAHRTGDKLGGGTPPYMAPEQFTKGSIGIYTDVYSLGITIYEMLSGGYVPFTGASPGIPGNTNTREKIKWEHLHQPAPSLHSYNQGIPLAIEQVVAKMLEKDPKKRYSSVKYFQTEFERACGGNISPASSLFEEDRVKKTVLVGSTTSRTTYKKTPMQAGHEKVDRQPPISIVKGRYLLLGKSGEYVGRSILIKPGISLFGRGSECAVRFRDAAVSRHHFQLNRTARGIYVRDDVSRYGVGVNGKRIPKARWIPL